MSAPMVGATVDGELAPAKASSAIAGTSSDVEATASRTAVGRRAASVKRGVNWSREQMRWRSQIEVDSKTHYLGSYGSDADAARAYDKFCDEHHLARQRNFPKDAPRSVAVVLRSEKRTWRNAAVRADVALYTDGPCRYAARVLCAKLAALAPGVRLGIRLATSTRALSAQWSETVVDSRSEDGCWLISSDAATEGDTTLSTPRDAMRLDDVDDWFIIQDETTASVPAAAAHAPSPRSAVVDASPPVVWNELKRVEYRTQRPKETLSTIGVQHGVTPEQLFELNAPIIEDLRLRTRLRKSTLVLIPAGEMRLYAPGAAHETVLSISAALGLDAEELLALNAERHLGIALTSRVRRGIAIVVPSIVPVANGEVGEAAKEGESKSEGERGGESKGQSKREGTRQGASSGPASARPAETYTTSKDNESLRSIGKALHVHPARLLAMNVEAFGADLTQTAKLFLNTTLVVPWPSAVAPPPVPPSVDRVETVAHVRAAEVARLGNTKAGECLKTYRCISYESFSQFDSLPLTSCVYFPCEYRAASKAAQNREAEHYTDSGEAGAKNVALPRGDIQPRVLARECRCSRARGGARALQGR